MAKKPAEEPEVQCPVYQMLQAFGAKGKVGSQFVQHVKNAKVEILLAVRSLIDHRIEQLRSQARPRPSSRRIKVSEKK